MMRQISASAGQVSFRELTLVGAGANGQVAPLRWYLKMRVQIQKAYLYICNEQLGPPVVPFYPFLGEGSMLK